MNKVIVKINSKQKNDKQNTIKMKGIGLMLIQKMVFDMSFIKKKVFKMKKIETILTNVENTKR
mgnify:CR=1 FL=1